MSKPTPLFTDHKHSMNTLLKHSRESSLKKNKALLAQEIIEMTKNLANYKKNLQQIEDLLADKKQQRKQLQKSLPKATSAQSVDEFEKMNPEQIQLAVDIDFLQQQLAHHSALQLIQQFEKKLLAYHQHGTE